MNSSAACAITLCSSSTSLDASNAALCVPTNGWEEVLKPVIARYADRHLMRLFRGDAAFDIRLYANRVLQGRIAHLHKRPVGRPPKGAKRIYGDVEYQAASWDKPSRIIPKIERHPGALFPRIGFVITNLPIEPDWIIRFYKQRDTAEQHIEEGKQASNWTRLSCKGMAQNEIRLQLHALIRRRASRRLGMAARRYGQLWWFRPGDWHNHEFPGPSRHLKGIALD